MTLLPPDSRAQLATLPRERLLALILMGGAGWLIALQFLWGGLLLALVAVTLFRSPPEAQGRIYVEWCLLLLLGYALGAHLATQDLAITPGWIIVAIALSAAAVSLTVWLAGALRLSAALWLVLPLLWVVGQAMGWAPSRARPLVDMVFVLCLAGSVTRRFLDEALRGENASVLLSLAGLASVAVIFQGANA